MKRQPKRRIMQIDTSFRNADGLFLELNLEPQLMKRVAKNSPIIRNTGSGGNKRGSRYVVLNDTTLTSKSLLEELRIKIEKKLSTLDDEERRITVGTSLSNAEWVVAAPNCRATGGGTKEKGFFIPTPLEKGELGYDMISQLPYFYPNSPLQETSVHFLKNPFLLLLFTGS